MKKSKEIIVEPDEYKTATSPDELFSGGVGPYIVLGTIYNKKGYMIYMNPLNSDFPTSFEPLFRELKDDLNLIKKGRPKIYIIGGETGPQDVYERDILKNRQNLLNKIKEAEFRKYIKELKWCPREHTQSLRLILSKSEAEIKQLNPREERIINEGIDSNYLDDDFSANLLKEMHKNRNKEDDPWEDENTDKYYNAQGILVKQNFED